MEASASRTPATRAAEGVSREFTHMAGGRGDTAQVRGDGLQESTVPVDGHSDTARAQGNTVRAQGESPVVPGGSANMQDDGIHAQSDTARVQGDRSAATRKRVLDATLECLLEFGYAGTTTSAIQARAGVSRGAMTHQFPSKAGLMIAAVQYLSDVRSRRILEALEEMPPGGNRLRESLRLAWAEYDGDLFKAALELWTASRTDDALHRALLDAERELGQRQRALFGDLMRPSNDELLTKAEVDLIARLMRGTALTNILRRSKTDPDVMVEESLRAVGRV